MPREIDMLGFVSVEVLSYRISAASCAPDSSTTTSSTGEGHAVSNAAWETGRRREETL
jgi:hypothetical protein